MNVLLKKGKIRDGLMVIMLFLELTLMKIAVIFTCKPHYVDYIKAKLRNRFDTKDIAVDKDNDTVSFYLSNSHDLTKRDKLNTAKVFGLTLKNVKFVRVNEYQWKITFLPKGIGVVKALIQTFPNLAQQVRTGKTVSNFEPEEVVFLNREQKLRLRKEQKKVWSVLIDIFDYLMIVPILGFLLRQIYWHRNIFNRIINKMPEDSNDIKILPYMLAGISLFIFIMYTFAFWATLFCLLVAGYGLYKLKGVIKLKT